MTYVIEDDKVTLAGDGDDQDDDDRPMNDTTMPPPSSAVVASRTSRTASSPAAAAVVKPPGVAIRPRPRSSRHKAGFGLADWNRLVRTSRNLAMRADPKAPLRRSIPWSEIQTHNSAVHDGWVVLRGKVYNLSPYLDYHPGGARILQKIVGKDITALYDQYHRWVNEEGLVGTLLVGYVEKARRPTTTTTSYLPTAVTGAGAPSDGFAVPAPRPVQKVTAAPSAFAKDDDDDEEEEADTDPWD